MQNFYPNYFQNPMMPQQPIQPKSNRIWVSGEEGAKSYLIAPNTSVDLWDSEAQTIYIKTADTSGRPSIQVIDYTIRDNQNIPVGPRFAPESNFITKDDILPIEDKINELESKLERINNRRKSNLNKTKENKNE